MALEMCSLTLVSPRPQSVRPGCANGVMRSLKQLRRRSPVNDSHRRRRDWFRRGVHFVFASVLFAGLPVRAQDASFWSFLRAGRVVKRCADSTPAHEQAKTRLNASISKSKSSRMQTFLQSLSESCTLCSDRMLFPGC
jgi:hypothetical protein